MVSLIFKGPNLVFARYFYCMTPPSPQLTGISGAGILSKSGVWSRPGAGESVEIWTSLESQKKPVELPLASRQNGIVVWSHVFWAAKISLRKRVCENFMCFFFAVVKTLEFLGAGLFFYQTKFNPWWIFGDFVGIQERMNDPNNPYTVDQFTYVDQSDRFVGAPDGREWKWRIK